MVNTDLVLVKRNSSNIFRWNLAKVKKRRKFCTTWLNKRNQIPGRHKKLPKVAIKCLYTPAAHSRRYDIIIIIIIASTLFLSVLKSLKAHHKHVGREIEFDSIFRRKSWLARNLMNSDHSTLDSNKSFFKMSVVIWNENPLKKKVSWWRWKWYSSMSFFRASSSCPFLMFFLGYYDKRIAAWRRPPKSKGTHTHNLGTDRPSNIIPFLL